jgi:MFS family permease
MSAPPTPPPGTGTAGASSRPPESLPVRGLWPLFVGSFFLAAGGGLIFPLLAELQEAHELPTWGLGVISALFFAGSVVGQLLLAPLGDRGHARALLLVGAAANVAALVWFAFATELWQFSLARGISGLATGMFLPAARASLVRADPARAGLLLGRFAGTETGGFVLGPVLGTVIFQLFGLQAPFLVVAAFVVVVLVVLTRVVLPGTTVGDPLATVSGSGDPGGPAPSPLRAAFASLDLLRHRGVVVAVLLQLSVFLPVGIYDSLWARYLDDRGASTLLIGVGLSLYGLPFVLAAPKGGRLADRLGPVRSTTLGMVVVVPATAAYGLLAAPMVIIGLALVEAVGNATAVPGAQTAMARSCPPHRQSAGQGLAGAVSMLGAGVAAGIAAPVYEAVGPEWLFTGAAVLMGLLVVGARRLDTWGGSPAVPRRPREAGPEEDPTAAVDTPVGPVPFDPADA